MTITTQLTSTSSSPSSTSSSYESNFLYQNNNHQQSSTTSPSFDSLTSLQNRNQNALQRRAQQLRRWREMEEHEQKGNSLSKHRATIKVCFSPTTLFLSACAQRDFDECDRLLKLKELKEVGGVDVTNCDGLTALHQACIDDNEPMVKWLLSRSANINCKDNEGWTPIHASANCGYANIVKVLLSYPECNVFALNCDNELACDVCETKECENAIRDRMNQVLKRNNSNSAKLIRKNLSNSSVNDDDENGDDEDDEEEENEAFKELRLQELKAIEYDVTSWIDNKNAIDIKLEIEKTRDLLSGATILHVCAAKGYNQILNLFLNEFSKQFDLDSFRDCDGYTALHASAFWRQPETFETLLKFGANPELQTEKTSDNLISSSVLELCKNDPKFVELIEISKEKEKIAKESETQRKIFAKRQREQRRSTQGVKKEDLEKALKMMEITQTTVQNPSPQVLEKLIDVSKANDFEKSPTQNLNVVSNDENERQNSIDIENEAVTCLTIKLPAKQLNQNLEENDFKTEQSKNETIGYNININEPETPPTLTMKISSTTPAEFARRRRTKRRATGIEDDSGHALSPDLLATDSITHPLSTESIDAAFDVILSAPSSQSRSTRITRPVSNASSTSSLNSSRNLEDSESNNVSASSSVNSLFHDTVDVHREQPMTTSQSKLQNSNEKSTNSSSFNSSNNNSTINTNLNKNSISELENLKESSSGGSGNVLFSDEIDYKKLCKQLLKENEILRRRIKELEEAEKKREQEFNREKRSLQRSIGEHEEELKAMNDIKADNMRLKDENAALIRVISKLSKN